MPTADVLRALELPVAERAPALLALAEDQWFDRKSARVHPRDLADAMIAFANAEGGVLVLGLHDGRVESGELTARKLNGWQQAGYDFAVPPLRSKGRSVACLDDKGRERDLYVVEVEASTHVHANQRDEVLLRVGDENRKLGFQQRQELMYEKGQASYEATVLADLGFDDLEPDLVNGYAGAVGHPDGRRLLIARGLLTARGELTIGGLLLFGRAPQARFPEARVRVLRYRGKERGTGARQQLLDDVGCEGPIPTIIEQAQAAITRLVPTRRALGADGRFGPVGLVPRDAWLEGLVNAVVHRAYSVMGDHVRVEIFDDRVEIESPGRFPGLVDLSDPTAINRFARNPRIARVCADLDFGQELGEGIRRIFEEMRLAGLVDPRYVQTAGSVRLTLSAAAVDRQLESRLPAEAREVLRHVRDAGRASTGDLVDATGLSRPVVLSRLKALRDAGLLEWVGNSPRDPRAYWRLPVD